MSDSAAAPKTPFTPYQRKLFVFLSVATLFEGYDFMALSQILPQLRRSMGLDETAVGAMVTAINLGTVFAFALVGLADRWGRRRLLTITIAGYTLTTFATGFAPDLYWFTGLQFLARMFLLAEWATSMVVAAEEFPADRRGTVMGVVGAFSSLGAIVCAGVVPFLLRSSHGWRSVYFVGIVPLVVLMLARRSLRETERFAREVGPASQGSLWRIWSTPYRSRVVLLATIWGLAYVCINNATVFWKQFAVEERGFTDDEVGFSISIAAVASMPLIFLAGKLLDRIGRRRGAAVIFLLGTLGVFLCYGLHDRAALTVALVFGIFGAGAVLPVLNALNAELFPTALRADAFAWANNLLGRITYVLSPLAIGWSAKRIQWGPTLQLSTVGPLLALALILLAVPETASRDLDDTAAL